VNPSGGLSWLPAGAIPGRMARPAWDLFSQVTRQARHRCLQVAVRLPGCSWKRAGRLTAATIRVPHDREATTLGGLRVQKARATPPTFSMPSRRRGGRGGPAAMAASRQGGSEFTCGTRAAQRGPRSPRPASDQAQSLEGRRPYAGRRSADRRDDPHSTRGSKGCGGNQGQKRRSGIATRTTA
jgi:hypothetical protein